MTNTKKEIEKKVILKRILVNLVEVTGNLLVLSFFATLWLSLTYLLAGYIIRFSFIFIIGWIIGGFILVINSIRINWFPLNKIINSLK